jgi:juvenile hormone epoxide hydrolase
MKVLVTALNSNPVGLAAWILEKFSTATNLNNVHRSDGGFSIDSSLDPLLDNVMIYYLSNSATTSCRIYKEAFETPQAIEYVAVEVPTGSAHFKQEALHQFKFLTQSRFKRIIHETFHEIGGHFAALQVPEVLYQDFLDFVRKTLDDL